MAERIVCRCFRRWADSGGSRWFPVERTGEEMRALYDDEIRGVSAAEARKLIFWCGCPMARQVQGGRRA